MNIRSIKFIANEPQQVTVVRNGRPGELLLSCEVTTKARQRLVEWQLGMGPCGRHVESLRVDITLSTLTIRQESFSPEGAEKLVNLRKGMAYRGIRTASAEEVLRFLDNDRKIEHFVYKLEDVVGRIKFEGV